LCRKAKSVTLRREKSQGGGDRAKDRVPRVGVDRDIRRRRLPYGGRADKGGGLRPNRAPSFRPYHFDARVARRIIDDYDLAINASLGLSDATDISSDREECVGAGEALLGATLDALSELGGEHLVGVIYGALKKHMRPATKTGRANGLNALRRLASRAERRGIKVGLEVVNRYETNIMNTAKEASDGSGRFRTPVPIESVHRFRGFRTPFPVVSVHLGSEVRVALV
jgi:hypothetical protein